MYKRYKYCNIIKPVHTLPNNRSSNALIQLPIAIQFVYNTTISQKRYRRNDRALQGFDEGFVGLFIQLLLWVCYPKGYIFHNCCFKSSRSLSFSISSNIKVCCNCLLLVSML